MLFARAQLEMFHFTAQVAQAFGFAVPPSVNLKVFSSKASVVRRRGAGGSGAWVIYVSVNIGFLDNPCLCVPSFLSGPAHTPDQVMRKRFQEKQESKSDGRQFSR